MPLTPEQIANLKEQLRSQIQHLAPEPKAEAEKQIESLSPEALESMLKQQSKGSKEKSVFRLIVEKQIPSYNIDENNESIAVLEINPVSKGHLLVIPKLAARTSKEIPTKAFALAKKLSKKIISKLKAVSTEIQTESKFGEAVINVIPVYDKAVGLSSERYKASKPELEALESKLKVKKAKRIQKIKLPSQQAQKSEPLKLPRRIP